MTSTVPKKRRAAAMSAAVAAGSEAAKVMRLSAEPNWPYPSGAML
jgi:hypothetical protein